MYTGPLLIASDHAGFQLKKRLVRYLEHELLVPVTDLGPASFTGDDDYPDYTFPLTDLVIQKNGRGILICANGIGVCIAANKVPGVRAGIGYNLMAAETMMTDDDTNILCFGAKLSSDEHAMAILKRWLESTPSQEERHVRRRKKVADYETKLR